MLKLKYEPRFFREHPVLTRVLVLGYTAFICCFIFPLGNTASLHLSFFILLIALCLAEAWGPGRAASVFLLVLAAAAAGLLGRYLLEYGEVSNTRNFTVENVLWFLFSVPLAMTVAYHFLVKWLQEHSGSRE